MDRRIEVQPDEPGVYSEAHEEDTRFAWEHLHPAAVALIGAVLFGLVFMFAWGCHVLDRLLGR